jgi:hypothetical protein
MMSVLKSAVEAFARFNVNAEETPMFEILT